MTVFSVGGEVEILFRAELPRLYELKDSVHPESPDSYFRNFDRNLAGSASLKDCYLRYERTLQGLDNQAWEHLMQESLSRVTEFLRNGRGWQPLFDILNEARAYNYLKLRGCAELHFIPRGQGKTPDLTGVCASRLILCEVKTINIFDEEVEFRTGRKKLRSGQVTLPARFLRKLREKIEDASEQLSAFDPGGAATHLAYLNVSFDDILGECKERYFRQIDEDLSARPVMGIELVICNDYTPFYKPLQMRFADVDNTG